MQVGSSVHDVRFKHPFGLSQENYLLRLFQSDIDWELNLFLIIRSFAFVVASPFRMLKHVWLGYQLLLSESADGTAGWRTENDYLLVQVKKYWIAFILKNCVFICQRACVEFVNSCWFKMKVQSDSNKNFELFSIWGFETHLPRSFWMSYIFCLNVGFKTWTQHLFTVISEIL